MDNDEMLGPSIADPDRIEQVVAFLRQQFSEDGRASGSTLGAAARALGFDARTALGMTLSAFVRRFMPDVVQIGNAGADVIWALGGSATVADNDAATRQPRRSKLAHDVARALLSPGSSAHVNVWIDAAGKYEIADRALPAAGLNGASIVPPIAPQVHHAHASLFARDIDGETGTTLRAALSSAVWFDTWSTLFRAQPELGAAYRARREVMLRQHLRAILPGIVSAVDDLERAIAFPQSIHSRPRPFAHWRTHAERQSDSSSTLDNVGGVVRVGEIDLRAILKLIVDTMSADDLHRVSLPVPVGVIVEQVVSVLRAGGGDAHAR